MKHFLVTASFCFFDFFLVLSSVSTISARTQARPRATREPIKFSQGDETLGLWRNEIWETVQSSGPVSLAPQGILVLAAKRTNMPDILSGLKRYQRGWDKANPHYWTKRRSRSNEKMNELQNVVPNSEAQVPPVSTVKALRMFKWSGDVYSN